ncbi:alpha/beta hydrolase [Tropicimonas isoalkanivorans]|uniref:Lysophospholipase, alpha-beta hydrolase superfamily n=1 Tax=Tropicimonas isoalkanivorans TaxID=441112 RepID=A0A1I1P0K9_9RHOB|nr:alpha/beta fold hydrolase [Tropicimonas isoalkanivorans]SFD03347.1 Lysophospholipase, alpha-beta hydrolase superfamily [Tropicimonas isoalkanivorans]
MRGDTLETTTPAAVDYQGWALSRHEPAEVSQPHDLLFVHGMAGGSWVWTEEWLARFTDAGYRCWTLTLPGRGSGPTAASDPGAVGRAVLRAVENEDARGVVEAIAAALPGTPLFDGPDLGDYTDALTEALAAIGTPTVVVGHSLGGAVAQNLLRRGTRPAGTVLLCSAPPYGLWRASMEMAFTNPQLWRALFAYSLFGLAAVDLEVMRRNLFPGGIEQGQFLRMLTRLTDESLAATARTRGFPPFAPLPGPRADILVIGGGQDRLVPPLDIHLTGMYYATRPRSVEGAGHMPMFEPQSYRQTANFILDWLPRLTPHR